MSILVLFNKLGEESFQLFGRLGKLACFIYQSVMYHDKRFFHEFIKAIYQQGVECLILMSISAFFIGMVLALQGYLVLTKFGAEEVLGQLIALSVVKELGPVMCSLFFIGCSCSTITAELAIMRSTMQIDSLEVIGINPLARLIAPRLWAVLVVAPSLLSLFMTVSILGGAMTSLHIYGIDYGVFWSNIVKSIKFYDDIVKSLMKGTIFFFVSVCIALYEGYFVEANAEAVARATTRTVVLGSVLTLALDFILTSFTVSS